MHPADRTPSIIITSNSRISLIISAISPHAEFRALEGERVAPTWRQQDRCHEHLREESISRSGNSHGFELNRTVSYSQQEKRTGTRKLPVKIGHLSLAADGDAQSAHVAAAVERPE